MTQNAFAFAASAMIPIGQASTAGNLTFKSTATIVAKEGISMGAGAGAQKITTDVTGNDTAGMVAGMVASGMTAKGLNGIEAEANKLAKAPKGIDGVTEGAGNLAEDVGKVVESGRESSIMDYSNRFADSLAEDFNPGVEVRDVVKEDMILVQFSSDAPNASLRYWTTIDEANGISTIEEYMDKMALSKEWGNRNVVKVARVKKGTEVTHAIGTAKAQTKISDPRPGNGKQILFSKFDSNWITEVRNIKE